GAPTLVCWSPARGEGLVRLGLGSFDPSLRLAFDFRHDSWDGIEADLPPNAVRVGSLAGEAPFRYLRLREPPYDDAELRAGGGARGAGPLPPPAPARAAVRRRRARGVGRNATTGSGRWPARLL